ncbi:MAG: glycine zipper 2TM domain-containing protein [Erythrobacter sp.]
MKTFSIFAIAGSMLALALPAAPAQAAELPRASLGSLSAPAAWDGTGASSFPVIEVAEQGRGRGRGNGKRIYDGRGRYYEPRRLGRNDRVWRGRDGRFHCRRDNGTTGLIVGAGVGALLGRELDQSGDRALGTIAGAVGGGLLGRELDRGGLRCR